MSCRQRNEKNINTRKLETPKPKTAVPAKSILKVPGKGNIQKKSLIFASPTKDNSPKKRKVC